MYAAGDPNQLPPVGEKQSKELSAPSEEKTRRMKAIRSLFPHQMTLTQCKRATSDADRKQLTKLCRSMLSPGFDMIKVRDLVYENFKSLTWDEAIDLLAENDTCPDSCLAVCYYNKTCTKVAEAVIPSGEKCTVGIRLVNRERKFCKGGGTLMVNFEYEVVEVKDQDVVLECIHDHHRLTCSKYHVYSSMRWSWTRGHATRCREAPWRAHSSCLTWLNDTPARSSCTWP